MLLIAVWLENKHSYHYHLGSEMYRHIWETESLHKTQVFTWGTEEQQKTGLILRSRRTRHNKFDRSVYVLTLNFCLIQLKTGLILLLWMTLDVFIRKKLEILRHHRSSLVDLEACYVSVSDASRWVSPEMCIWFNDTWISVSGASFISTRCGETANLFPLLLTLFYSPCQVHSGCCW